MASIGLGKLINHSMKNVSSNERKMLFERYFIKPTAIIYELVAKLKVITSVREVTSTESITVSRPERSGFYML
jgi:hypothetical protein